MPNINFGVGNLFLTRTDIPNAQPVKVGVLQDVNLMVESTLKELYGQGQYPVALARGSSKITGDAKFAQISLPLVALYTGQPITAGQTLTVVDEAATIPAAAPFQVTAANNANFLADLGVAYASNGLPLQKVVNNPQQGQYSQLGAVYSFNALDTGAPLLLRYQYTNAQGGRITVINPFQGIQPYFRLDLFTLLQQQSGPPQKLTFTLFACVANTLSFPAKINDFTMQDFKFQAAQDGAGRVYDISLSDPVS